MSYHPMSLAGFHEDRQIGDWKVETRTVGASVARLRPRAVPPGTYTGLLHKGSLWMSDTPDERRDHMLAYCEAKRRGGRVLVHGLGLGMIVKAMLELPRLEHVDVVEIEPDVIALCSAAFQPQIDAGRLTIHAANCLDLKWSPGTHWTVVWHDIWRDICTDNLPEMATLHRKFGQRCDWQGSWSHGLLLALRRRSDRYAFA